MALRDYELLDEEDFYGQDFERKGLSQSGSAGAIPERSSRERTPYRTCAELDTTTLIIRRTRQYRTGQFLLPTSWRNCPIRGRMLRRSWKPQELPAYGRVGGRWRSTTLPTIRSR